MQLNEQLSSNASSDENAQKLLEQKQLLETQLSEARETCRQTEMARDREAEAKETLRLQLEAQETKLSEASLEEDKLKLEVRQKLHYNFI